MLELPVYNRNGEQVETIEIDAGEFGGHVRKNLLKQAIVMYQANSRQRTAATKSRGMVRGSGRKLYRQKHTGRARMGSSRTVIRTGGGVAFAKGYVEKRLKMPKKAKRLARRSAMLAKMLDNEVMVIDQLDAQAPKTKEMSTVLKNLGINSTCLIIPGEYNENLFLSTRNIPRVSTMPVNELNAYDALRHKTVLVTREGLDKLRSESFGPSTTQPQVES